MMKSTRLTGAFARKAAVAGLVLAMAGAAQAADPTVPEAIARAEVMTTIGQNMKVLGDMARGKTTYDATAAEAAKAALLAAADRVASDFKVTGAEDPVSEAKPEIWTNWEDFLAKDAALKTAVEGIDVASADSIKAGMGPIGAACKACHSVYRE